LSINRLYTKETDKKQDGINSFHIFLF